MRNQVATRCVMAAAVFAAALFGVAAPAADRPGIEESKALVENVVDEATRTWRKEFPDDAARFEAMNAIVQKTFAVAFITRAVLGRYWRELSDAERDEIGEVLPRFMVRVYLPHIAKYGREHIRVRGARARGKRDVVVKSQVRTDGGSGWLDTDWRIRAFGDDLRVLDIVVAGVSLILVQRQEFEGVIRERGAAGLLELLRERVERPAGDPDRG